MGPTVTAIEYWISKLRFAESIVGHAKKNPGLIDPANAIDYGHIMRSAQDNLEHEWRANPPRNPWQHITGGQRSLSVETGALREPAPSLLGRFSAAERAKNEAKKYIADAKLIKGL